MKAVTSPNTHIGTVRTENLTQLQQVCDLLGWTHEQYCNHQYGEYERFIKQACLDLPKATDTLRHSAVFRGFYNQEWAFRNKFEFLPFAIELTTPICIVNMLGKLIYDPGIEKGDQHLVQEYYFIHSAPALFHDSQFATRYAHTIDLILKLKDYGK